MNVIVNRIESITKEIEHEKEMYNQGVDRKIEDETSLSVQEKTLFNKDWKMKKRNGNVLQCKKEKKGS